jgi:outer membrane protein OmpA-like peptidoglycan-associated protein
MAALRTLSYLTRAAMLIACAWVYSAAAQDSEQSAAQAVETEEASAPQQQEPAQESAQETELAGDVSAQDADSDEESGARFIPTEEISQDFGVSFPVDI